MYAKNIMGALVGLSLFGMLGTAAEAVTIDFGAADIPAYGVSSTVYTEDGFDFTILSGAEWGISNVSGNPGAALVAGYSAAVGIGDTISVKRVAGGLFTFDSFDFHSFLDGLLSDTVNLLGLVSGSQT